MPRLLDFKMDCCLPVSHSKMQANDRVMSIRRILREAKHLQSLALTLEISDNDWSELLLIIRFPYLKLLDLENATLVSKVF